MKRYENGLISLRSAKSAYTLIEKFTFQFNAMTGARGGGGVSNMYAKLAQNAMRCTAAQEFADVVQDMKDKFKERIPDEDEFTVAFSRIMFRTSYTKDRNLVRYVLTQIAKHYGMPEELDVSMMTIEHILPQSVGQHTGDGSDAGAIGNLIFVNEKLNGKLDDKPFKDKKKMFTVENNVYLDEELQAANEWGAQKINNRGLNLAKVGYTKIWNI